MADYPRGFYFNDAIINTLVISEAVMASPELLDLYSQAQYFDARLMPDSVEARYKAILAAGNSSMLGLTAYRLASFYIAGGRSEEALGVNGEIEKFYADNYFYPYCLKLKGDILFAQSERRGEAAELYRLILEKYSTYPFTGEVREKLQILEGYRVPG
jgi:tetratricopeptide (TPR) repeat protein